MQLYTLYFGKSKKKMKPIMTDVKHKCENYKDAREHTVTGWHDIRLAEPNSVVWRQKSTTIGGNKDNSGPARINRKGVAQINGYIGKSGFNPHT